MQSVSSPSSLHTQSSAEHALTHKCTFRLQHSTTRKHSQKCKPPPSWQHHV